MLVNIIKLHELCKNKEELVAQLIKWGLIPGDYKCSNRNCTGMLKIRSDADRIDEWRLRCDGFICHEKKKRRKCSNRVGIRTGTFMWKSKLSIEQVRLSINVEKQIR